MIRVESRTPRYIASDEESIPQDEVSARRALQRQIALLEKDWLGADGRPLTNSSYKAVRFHPLSGFRLVWDVLIVAVVVGYVCIGTPLRVAFSGPTTTGVLFGIDVGLTLLLAGDVAINFNTGLDDEGHITMDSYRVRSKYLSTYFAFDLTAALPWDIIVLVLATVSVPGERDAASQLMLCALRLGRLAKVPGMFRYVTRWEDLLPINGFQLRTAKLLFLVVLFAHTDGCLQLLIAHAQAEAGKGPTFLAIQGLEEATGRIKYMHGIFRALSNMVTIGYGIHSPANNTETAVIMVSVVFGAAFYVTLVGIMTSMAQRQDRSNTLYTEQMQMWREYLRTHDAPQALRRRVQATLRLRYADRRIVDEAGMMRDINPTLRTDITMHTLRDLLAHVPLLQSCRLVVARALVVRLDRSLYPGGDVVFHEGEVAAELFLVASGEVSISDKHGTPLATLGPGSYFGEGPLLAGGRPCVRTATCTALTYAELYVLTRPHWDMLVAHYPELLDIVATLSLMRQAPGVGHNLALSRVVAAGSRGLRASGQQPPPSGQQPPPPGQQPPPSGGSKGGTVAEPQYHLADAQYNPRQQQQGG